MGDELSVALSELVEVNPSTHFPTSGPCSFIGMQHVSEDGRWVGNEKRNVRSASGYTPFQDNDVLFAKITPCMENGKGALVANLEQGVGFGSTEFHVLRSKEGTDPRFIAQWTRSIRLRSSAEAHMTGSAGQRRVPAGFFREFQIRSYSLDEQRKIAEVLDTVDESIRSTEHLIAKLEFTFAGLANDLVSFGIDRAGRARNPTHNRSDLISTSIGLVPKGWKIGPLGDQVTLQRGFDITVAEQRPGQVPVVSSSGISSFHDKAMASGPGVVIGRKGKLGNAYYVERDFWPHDTSLWVKDFHGNNRKYVALLLTHMQLERFDAATSVPTLNRNFVHPILVAFPEREEQDRVVKYLEIRNSRLGCERQALAKLRKVKQGLMEDLLTGRVRMTVD